MNTRSAQRLLDRHFPGAWSASPMRGGGFTIRRTDAVDAIQVSDLVELAALFVGFKAYITKELRTEYLEDGVDFGVWLDPEPIKTRSGLDRRGKARRIADKAARRLKRK